MSDSLSQTEGSVSDWIDIPATNEIDAQAKAALKAFHYQDDGWQAAMECLFRALSDNAQDNALPNAPRIPIDGAHLVGVFGLLAAMFASAKSGTPHPLMSVATTGGRPRLSGVDLMAAVAVATVMGLARVRAEIERTGKARIASIVAKELQDKGAAIDARECRSHWNNRLRLPDPEFAAIETAVAAFREAPEKWAYDKALWDAASILRLRSKAKSKAPIY